MAVGPPYHRVVSRRAPSCATLLEADSFKEARCSYPCAHPHLLAELQAVPLSCVEPAPADTRIDQFIRSFMLHWLLGGAQKPQTNRSASRLIALPAVLDIALASELRWIADEKRHLVLPMSPSADAVLESFVAERRKSTGTSADAAVRFAKRIGTELREALGTKLLYSAERQQYRALRKQAQKASRVEAEVAAASPMDVLIGQTYGAQHLLRLLVAVPALRSISAEDAPTAEDTTQPTPVLAQASVPDAGSPSKHPQQESRGPVEMEHFIRFLASHTGISEWLGDDAAYVARAPRVGISERDTSKPATKAIPVATATGTCAATSDVTVGPSTAAGSLTLGEGKRSMALDWRERALNFLSAVDGDL